MKYSRHYQCDVNLVKSAIISSLLFLSIAPTLSQASKPEPQLTQQTSQNIISNNYHPKIQIAILLDTSGSMDGLIDQARNQIWQAVNEFAKAKHNGVRPTLEVALYEYGNDGLSKKKGFTRKVLGLSNDLDKVSEALFSLTTNGGSEYCGYAIKSATLNLAWSPEKNDIKAIFIAGNEPFSQGPVQFRSAIKHAKTKGITVNTIHAGSYNNGIQSGWMEGATLASGSYMNIDHNQKVVHIIAPQDKQIAMLNTQLNQTYVPYGKKGREGASRQLSQDTKTNSISAGLLAKRAKSKVSSLYNSASWDLVDALEKKTIKLEDVKERDLPVVMKPMSSVKRKAYLDKQLKQRKNIKQEISRLSNARDAYIAKKKTQSVVKEGKTLDKALIQAIHKQGNKKSYVFE